MARIYGACAGLLAFAITILRGLAVDNPTETILARALLAMLIFLVLGSVVGWVGQAVVDEHKRLMQEEEARAQEEAEAEIAAERDASAGDAGDEGPGAQGRTTAAPEGAGLPAR